MKRALSLIFALALCLALSTGALAADEIIEPGPDFYVTDNAGTLSESTKELIINASGPLERYCDGAQICVVTISVPSSFAASRMRFSRSIMTRSRS